METATPRGDRDSQRLPTLRLGLSSVRLIVNRLESEYGRLTANTLDNCRELVKFDPNVDEGFDDHDFLLDPSKSQVWSRFVSNLGQSLSKCIPSVSIVNFGVIALATGLFTPRMISYLVVYPFCRLVFGTLYPAYASYKAVRTKNLKEYVKWMMYWIVFALFTCTETFTDVFLSWFPFYYEVKIVIVLWLLSPATKGSSILYRKFVHPALCRREQEIDEYIAKAKDQGYHTVLNLGTKGVNYATTVIMQTAIKGGGGLVQQLRKSYSLSDLSECEPREERGADEADDVLSEPRVIRRVIKTTRRSASESNSASLYFPEVDVDIKPRTARADEPDFSHIKSSDDISSGYSSADNSASLARAGSLGPGRRRARPALTAVRRAPPAEGNEVIIEELHDDDNLDYDNMPPLVNLTYPLYVSQSDPPFVYQYIGDQIKIIQVLDNIPLSPNINDNTENLDKRPEIQVECTETTPVKQSDVDATKSGIVAEADLCCDNVAITNVPKECADKNNNTKTKNIGNLEENSTARSENLNMSTNLCANTPKDDDKGKVDVEDDITKTDTFISNIESHTECTSINISINENYSAESDDEASFGTPDHSPKCKRKSPRGKYGKGKAPLPPIDLSKTCGQKDQVLTPQTATSQESLVDLINTLPNTPFKETGQSKSGLQVVNPIAEKKRRHKSKSPGRLPKNSGSGIGKLLQLPGKLAFWHKSDDKTKPDETSMSSDDGSRRSSTIEKHNDEFGSCADFKSLVFNPFDDVVYDNISFKDASDVDNESITHDIMEKSDVLQKLIDAKLESHPEYKYLSLHEDMPSSSKSTDV